MRLLIIVATVDYPSSSVPFIAAYLVVLDQLHLIQDLWKIQHHPIKTLFTSPHLRRQVSHCFEERLLSRVRVQRVRILAPDVHQCGIRTGITGDLLDSKIKTLTRFLDFRDLGRDGSQQRTLVIGHNRRRRFNGSHDAFSVL